MRRFIHILIFSGLTLLTALTFAEEITPPLPADIRIVIDISGSMKKTDPQNLRKPAIGLITRLLPDRSKAGLWTFGQSVNMLVPHRVVDPLWRSEGAQKAASINSIAMFTNIGAALETAAQDDATPAQQYRRNIILLTDGVVDISTEAVVNLNERKRILTELLPRLKKSGYRIHTIALSGAADDELLKKLSVSTDGVFKVADTAEELMSTFLQIFDQAVPAERVPLDENGFLVDASIQEFTALIFRSADVPETIITAPDGKEFNGTDPANNVNWYRTSQYDLITVQQPVKGQWKVKTAMAPNSRVTVVSNLQLLVAPLNNNIRSNQSLNVRYSFQENNQTVTNPDFLGLMTGKALIAKLKSPEVAEIVFTNPVSAQGIFQEELKSFNGPGEYSITIAIDGKTFKREFVHQLNIADSPFALKKHIDETGANPERIYTLTADLQTVDVESTKVTARIKNSKGSDEERLLNLSDKNNWQLSYTPEQAAHYKIVMQVDGKQVDGSGLTETISADKFEVRDEAAVNAAAKPGADVAAASAASPPAADASPPAADAEADNVDSSSNLLLYIGIGVGNLLVLVLGVVVYRLIAGKGEKDELAEIEATLNDSAAISKKNAPKKVTIDVSGNEPTAHIPMNDTSGSDVTKSDDLMADNLFPLDNMDESDSNKK